MFLVRQQHQNSCVPACIATLTGLPYNKALRLVYRWKKTKRWDHYGTKHEDTLRAIKRAGFRYKERKPISFSKLRTSAIIVVENDVYGPPGYQSHVVVWDYEQQRVLDPYVGKGMLKRHLLQRIYEKSATIIIEIR